MKKYIILIICTLLSSLAFAQKSPCRKIDSTYNEFKEETVFRTPYIDSRKNYRVATLYSVKWIDKKQTLFVVYANTTTGVSNYSAKGTYFKFEDGTIIKDESDEVRCSILDISRYSMTGAVRIGSEDAQIFATKKIVKIALDDIEVPIEDGAAQKFMNIMACMKDKE